MYNIQYTKIIVFFRSWTALPVKLVCDCAYEVGNISALQEAVEKVHAAALADLL